MAYPVIIDTFSVVEPSNQLYHGITLPAGIVAGDLIIVFVSTSREDITSPYELGYGEGCALQTSNGTTSNFDSIIGTDPSVTDNSLHILYAIANGSGMDAVNYITRFWYKNSLNVILWGDLVSCRTSYVGYIIRGVGLNNNYNHGLKWRTTAGGISNWILNQCPASDDGITDDYLYLIAVSSNYDHIATTLPNTFTDLLTAQGAAVIRGTSVSSGRRESNQSTCPTSTFISAPTAYYFGYIIRLLSGTGTSVDDGFWIKVYKDSIGLP